MKFSVKCLAYLPRTLEVRVQLLLVRDPEVVHDSGSISANRGENIDALQLPVWICEVQIWVEFSTRRIEVIEIFYKCTYLGNSWKPTFARIAVPGRLDVEVGAHQLGQGLRLAILEMTMLMQLVNHDEQWRPKKNASFSRLQNSKHATSESCSEMRTKEYKYRARLKGGPQVAWMLGEKIAFCLPTAGRKT